jgi:hypothetical protein
MVQGKEMSLPPSKVSKVQSGELGTKDKRPNCLSIEPRMLMPLLCDTSAIRWTPRASTRDMAGLSGGLFALKGSSSK